MYLLYRNLDIFENLFFFREIVQWKLIQNQPHILDEKYYFGPEVTYLYLNYTILSSPKYLPFKNVLYFLSTLCGVYINLDIHLTFLN